MEIKALFGRFVWHGVNIDDVTIHLSWCSRINPTLKVCEHNQVAYACFTCKDSLFADVTLTLHKSQVHCFSNMQLWACSRRVARNFDREGKQQPSLSI